MQLFIDEKRCVCAGVPEQAQLVQRDCCTKFEPPDYQYKWPLLLIIILATRINPNNYYFPFLLILFRFGRSNAKRADALRWLRFKICVKLDLSDAACKCAALFRQGWILVNNSAQQQQQYAYPTGNLVNQPAWEPTMEDTLCSLFDIN